MFKIKEVCIFCVKLEEQRNKAGDKYMRIAICDDEKEQRVLLSEYCRRFDESLLVDTYNAAVDLLIVCDQISYSL